MDKMPLAAAATAPTTNAGKLPPPNRASHGPLITDTTIYIYTNMYSQLSQYLTCIKGSN
ncbi:hypothetical protein JHK82_056693 [Glycine max]|nr:hypothetical protein JHK82_056693 [Glycine max]